MRNEFGIFARRSSLVTCLCLLVGLLSTRYIHAAGKAAGTGQYLIYVGTYTRAESKGIYVYGFDASNGKVTSLGLAAETPNPSFLAPSANGRFLYAINETENFGAQKSGSVSAFAINRRTGKLILLNQVSSRGAGPAYISMDRTGRYVLVANYGGGSVAVFPARKNGRLGEASAFVQHTGSSVNPARQRSPHAHSISVSPDNRFALTADLGVDKVLVYRFNSARGSLEPNNPPFATVRPGSGPRHFVFSPDGRFVYVMSEMASTLTVFSYNAARGTLEKLQTISTLPAGFKGENTGAEVQVLPSGRFLYASNRGANSIAVFAVDPRTGALTPVEYVPTQGKTPRMFAIDPTGEYLLAANQDSDNIVIFRIDPGNGHLTSAGESIRVGAPVCVTFVRH